MSNNFYLWLFDNYVDSGDTNTRFGRANSNYEYGIRSCCFILEYESEAIADGKDCWNKLHPESKADYHKRYLDSIKQTIKKYKQRLLNETKYNISLL